MPFVMDNIKKRGYTLDFLHIPSGRTVSFRALITAFRDAYTSNWQATSVYGRQDPIETFQNTTRKISFSWKTVSEDQATAKKNLEDASLLYSMLYPTYSGDGKNAMTISTAPILKLRFSNLIQNAAGSSVGSGPVSARYVGGGLIGRSGGFTFEPDFETEGFFDLPNNILLPKTINFSCEFTVYHTHPVGWREDGTFIAAKFPYGEKQGGNSRKGANAFAGSEAKGEAIAKNTVGSSFGGLRAVTTAGASRNEADIIEAKENAILKGIK